jgi:hypothetical protein
MSLSSRRFQADGFCKLKAIDVVCVLLLVAYFLHFALPSLSGGFNVDEMTNIYRHWQLGMLKSLWANVCFWKGYIRPGGALYYLPLYHFFSLNPRPYRVVQVAILTASIPMVYYLAWLLASSRSVAFLGVFAFCYHAQLANLVFIGSFIYDVLCGFFYFAALTYYIHIREKGRELRPVQVAVFLTLYICALNSKEMALTLPVIVLAYETFRCPHFSERKQFLRQNWRFATPALIAGLLTVPYIYGKTMGTDALARLPPYQPRYSWHHFVASNAKFVNELLYLYHVFFPKGVLGLFPKGVLILWAIVFIYAWLRRDCGLRLMACWVVITPLPLAFIYPRGGACLYIPLFGWAMIFGKAASDLIMLIWKLLLFFWQRLGAAAGRRLDRMPPLMVRVPATVLVASALAIFTERENQRFGLIPGLLSVGEKTAHVIQAFRSLDLHPSRGSMILLKPENRFYQNGYYPAFVACLIWNDHSLSIYVDDKEQGSIGPFGFASRPLTAQEIATMDYVISFDEFRAKLIRAPNENAARISSHTKSATRERYRKEGSTEARKTATEGEIHGE